MAPNERGTAEEIIEELADEFDTEAEKWRELNRGWTGDEKHWHERKGMANAYDKAAARLRDEVITEGGED